MKILKSCCIFLLLIFLSFIYLSCSETNGKDDTENSTDSTKVESKNENESEKEKDLELIPVEVTEIKKGSISNFILLSTNLETESQTDVFPRIQGIIKKINHDEGDYVKSGQTLMELEADEYVLSEQRAKLNYKKQEADFERLKAMYSEDLLSKEEFEQARFSTEGLKVDWEQAKLNLSYTRIKSPISGVIGDRFRKTGDRIQPADRLFSVINTNEMIAVVYVPEKEISRVKKGQTAYITSDNLKNERFTGWLLLLMSMKTQYLYLRLL